MKARGLFQLSASVCGLGLLSQLLNFTNRPLFILSLIGTLCAAAPTLFLGFWIRGHSTAEVTRRLNKRLASANSTEAR